MNDAYVMERICQFPGQEAWKTEIGEGDVILEKWYGFTRLPASFDRVKAVEKEKVENRPYDPPDRLLRIKELREDGAVVAVLHQNIYYEGDMRVIEEYESLRTVSFGEIFSVYVKEPVMDAPIQPVHEFVIYRKDEPIEPWRPAPPEFFGGLDTSGGSVYSPGAFSRCCAECGTTAYYDDAANPPRFCAECGNRL